MLRSVPVTLVTEAYNLTEGQSEAAFLRAVAEVDRIQRQHEGVEIIVVDPSADNMAAPILARAHPNISTLHVPGGSYEYVKNLAAQRAKGEFIVFLDGDCRARHDDWLDRLLAPFSDPKLDGVAGLTFYEDMTITGLAMTVLDFGFLFLHDGQTVGCYASNNCAFRRSALLRLPIPTGNILRSYCYLHAQQFMRRGAPMRLTTRAIALHELPNIESERWRRGRDHIAALWADPELADAADVEPTKAFEDRIVAANLALALKRLDQAPPELGLSPADRPAVAAEIRRLIEKDRVGVADALREGEETGLNRQTRERHREVARK